MISVSDRFPVRTGDTVKDLDNLYDYLYQLERELRFELAKPKMTIALSAGTEICRTVDGIWIGNTKGDNGLNIKFGSGLVLVVDGDERKL